MRAHAACFLQYVPMLCITLSANYIEGYLSGNPNRRPTLRAWAILAFFVVSTIMETICLAYAVFTYEGTYTKEGREQHFPLDPHVATIVDCCWFLSLPIVGAMQPRAPN